MIHENKYQFSQLYFKFQISLPVKKESKIERMSRQLREIQLCSEKLRHLVQHFGQESGGGCLFCQQSRVVKVDIIFLISHLIIVHDRAFVESSLEENAETAILRIRTNLKGTLVAHSTVDFRLIIFKLVQHQNGRSISNLNPFPGRWQIDINRSRSVRT